MKKTISTLLSLIFLFFSLAINAQEYCGTVTKASISPTKYRVKVSMTGSSDFGIGSSNIVLSYNNVGLANPVYISSPIGPPFYQATSVTNPFDPGTGANVASINIEYSLGLCNNDFHYQIGTTDTEVVIIEFDILNDQLTSNIQWIYYGSTSSDGTVVYLCDDILQLSSQGDNTSCLLGLDQLLPIELKEFDVKAIDNTHSYLNWCTSSEINGSHFEIESSEDAESWRYIGEVASVGNGYDTEEYDYLDHNAIKAAGFGNQLYYRLKMVDLDGSYKYSEIKSVQFGESDKPGVSVFPNPTTSRVFIDLNMTEEIEFGNIEIVDMGGKTIGKYVFVQDEKKQHTLDLSNYRIHAGMYWLKIFVNGQYLSNERIIVVD